jgi:hypothetical protein
MCKVLAKILSLVAILVIPTLNAAAAERVLVFGPRATRAPIGALALVNKSYLILNQLYISSCGVGDWGPNQLAGVPLAPGRAFTFTNIGAGCYDLKVSSPPWFECVVGGARLQGYEAWIITSWTITRAVFGECSETSQIVSAGAKSFQ